MPRPTRRKFRLDSDDEDNEKQLRRKASEATDFAFDTVIVRVGTGDRKKTFAVAKNLLTKHSDSLASELEAKATAEVLETELPLHDPDDFDIFRRFIHDGHIYSKYEGDTHRAEWNAVEDVFDQEWFRLACAWVLGEALQSCSLKDAIVDAIVAKVLEDEVTPLDLQRTVYPKSTETSKIRKLLIDLMVWYTDAGDLRDIGWHENLGRFYFDLAVALDKVKVKGRSGHLPFKTADSCKYHEHGQEKACYKTMF